jgi:hypothetical protein
MWKAKRMLIVSIIVLTGAIGVMGSVAIALDNDTDTIGTLSLWVVGGGSVIALAALGLAYLIAGSIGRSYRSEGDDEPMGARGCARVNGSSGLPIYGHLDSHGNPAGFSNRDFS